MELAIHDVKELRVAAVKAFPATQSRPYPFWTIDLVLVSEQYGVEHIDKLSLFTYSPPVTAFPFTENLKLLSAPEVEEADDCQFHRIGRSIKPGPRKGSFSTLGA